MYSCSLRVLSILRPPHEWHTCVVLSNAHEFVKCMYVLICTQEYGRKYMYVYRYV